MPHVRLRSLVRYAHELELDYFDFLFVTTSSDICSRPRISQFFKQGLGGTVLGATFSVSKVVHPRYRSVTRSLGVRIPFTLLVAGHTSAVVGLWA